MGNVKPFGLFSGPPGTSLFPIGEPNLKTLEPKGTFPVPPIPIQSKLKSSELRIGGNTLSQFAGSILTNLKEAISILPDDSFDPAGLNKKTENSITRFSNSLLPTIQRLSRNPKALNLVLGTIGHRLGRKFSANGGFITSGLLLYDEQITRVTKGPNSAKQIFNQLRFFAQSLAQGGDSSVIPLTHLLDGFASALTPELNAIGKFSLVRELRLPDKLETQVVGNFPDKSKIPLEAYGRAYLPR